MAERCRVLGPPGAATGPPGRPPRSQRARTGAVWLLSAALGWALSAAPPSAAAQPFSRDALTITITPNVGDLPPAPVTDLAASNGAEGQLLLQWTAPDANYNALGSSSAVTSYSVRIATFSADSAGSTVTWWNGAQDVAGEPAPGQPGVLESLLLNNLEPGATCYAALRSFDGTFTSEIDLNAATPGAQAFAWIFDAAPAAPASLAVTAVGPNTVNLSWTASGATDLDFYRIYADSTTPWDFGDAFALTTDSVSASFSHTGLSPSTTYYYRVTAVDKGSPSFLGVALESAFSNAVGTVTLSTPPRLPMAPFGIGLSKTPTTATLTWQPVQYFEDRAPFADPLNAQADELNGYSVYRATGPTKAPWTFQVTVPSTTLNWTDGASGAQYYYYVSARNISGLSAPSMVRAHHGTAWLIGYDDLTTFEIPEAYVSALIGTPGDPTTAFRIETSSRPQDLTGPVLKSFEIQAWKGGVLQDPQLSLGGMGHMHIRFEKAGTQVTPSAVMPEAKNLSVFWYNGSKWVQLYGEVDELNQDLFVETKFLGAYQLRAVERLNEFSFDPAGVSNRQVTPNGDGKNDDVVFTFNNPRAAAVTGRILDVRGRVVAEMVPGPVSDSLLWDGRGRGVQVPGGVYIYQIESEGKVHSGTVIVIK